MLDHACFIASLRCESYPTNRSMRWNAQAPASRHSGGEPDKARGTRSRSTARPIRHRRGPEYQGGPEFSDVRENVHRNGNVNRHSIDLARGMLFEFK
jgi:hypothetical protein